jgi:kynurenine formamidase
VGRSGADSATGGFGGESRFVTWRIDIMNIPRVPNSSRTLLVGVLLGAALAGLATWVAGESNSASNPIGEKFWPSEFGADDQRGAANRLTPEKTIAAAKLVYLGRLFQLGRLYEKEMPIFGKRHYSLTIPGLPTGTASGDNQLVYNDELVSGEIGQIGTQFDGLGHVGIHLDGDDVFYNGNKLSEFGTSYGLKKLGIENAGVFFTRGILLDVCALRGDDRLPIGYVITPDELEACLDKAKLSIEPGDVVLIRTGHGKLWNKDNAGYNEGEPGLGLAAAKFLTDRKVTLIGADTWGIEAVPHERPGQAFPVHQWDLTKNGVYHLENLDLEELAAAKVSEFCFVFCPLRLKGATGSPGNPIAVR